MVKLAAKDSPWQAAYVGTATFTIGTEATNAITVNIQLMDYNGGEVNQRCAVHGYISTDSHGDNVSAAPQGGIAAGTDGVIIENIADVSFLAVSEADGDIDLVITDNGVATFHVVLVMPDGSLVVSSAITFA